MDRDLAYLDVKPQALAAFSSRVQRPNGRVTNNWSGPTIKYWQMLRRPDFSAYDAQARV